MRMNFQVINVSRLDRGTTLPLCEKKEVNPFEDTTFSYKYPIRRHVSEL